MNKQIYECSFSKLVRMIAFVLLLGYYIWILTSAWSMSGWRWSVEMGLYWTSAAGRLFPFPVLPGMAAVITPAHPVDQVFYIVFMHCGIWIGWIALGWGYLGRLIWSCRVRTLAIIDAEDVDDDGLILVFNEEDE